MKRHRGEAPRGRERGQRLSQLINQEVASLPEELQQKVYEFVIRLKKNARDEAFNGAELSDSVLALDWNSPKEDAAWSNL
jgi:hypothetical protein